MLFLFEMQFVKKLCIAWLSNHFKWIKVHFLLLFFLCTIALVWLLLFCCIESLGTCFLACAFKVSVRRERRYCKSYQTLVYVMLCGCKLAEVMVK